MNKTNLSLLDRRSLNTTISFVERLLLEDDAMSPQHRKRLQKALKRYQDTSLLLQQHLISTGGTMSHDSENDTIHD